MTELYRMGNLMSGWSFIGLFFWSFAFFAYFLILFWVIGDLFRDDKLNGWWKALWIVFVVFVPFLTGLVYLIVRGSGMAARRNADLAAPPSESEAYVAKVVTTPVSDQIAQAKALLDSGTISQSEFETLKKQALSG
jgi:Short C-terminal domain/Phospholipase_D-nuclease N-terminal